MLVGREPEQQLLEVLLDEARQGSAAALVVRGEPGVGKSALLGALVAAAGDLTVLTAQGLEAEAPLAFAALHRLLRPLDRLRAGLPAPQARALRMTFGEEEGDAVEPFLVGAATLSLLTAAAEEDPMLCVVDDAHWLDAATSGALLFCARRLGADRVAIVLAAREGSWGSFDPQGIREMTLTGLAPEASRALLRAHRGEAQPAVEDRIISETGGNPLALLELPTELTPEQLSGTDVLPTQLHLTARVEQIFLDRARRLPEPVQTVLLLLAADDSGDEEVVRRAVTELGLLEAHVDAALDSGLLRRGPSSLALRHPLVRSALHQTASAGQRRQVHAALATSLAGAGDPDRETWHRAAAADGPDPLVVAALEQVGSRAQRRGGHAAALAAYERAAGLSDDPTRRTSLTFAAARSAWACGQATHAQGLLQRVRVATTDPRLQADVARLRGHIEVNLGSAPEAHRIFVEAANAVHGDDPGRSLDIAVAAAVMRTFGADSGTPLRVADALGTPTSGDDIRTGCLRHLLVSMTRVSEGDRAAAVDALDQALALGEQIDDRDLLWNLGNAALQLGDDSAQQHFYGRALARAREAGAVTAVIYCLQRLCFSHYLAGNLVAVRSSAEEAISLGHSIGQPAMTAPPVAWLALLAAVQGSDDHDRHLARLDQLVASYPLGILDDPVHDLGRWARGLCAAAGGDHAGALHHLSRFRMPVLQRMSVTERVEAAVRAGDDESARRWVEELAAFAADTHRPWALAAVSLGRALTTVHGAEDHYREALTHHADAARPFDAARAHLALGEWLRRSQRRVDARQHLREALDTFHDLRAEAWATRADQELRASGETARKRDPSTLVKLTPTELQIARLVTTGLSNKDVAAQCWVSPRTVAFHLRNVFTKTGITSRGELAQLDLR
ncbi:helix-turn-helix transcriptional regulator [Nocardioides donggukensis]|uniref:AAA family ATPase n=1 Tax=Nocardioides donggukensis TaxID=2774019 RepID=A0A927K5G8_9ACTN|nr:helix-turn-helix transcriptional regulator [Nocardioides donggukensis]MBD8870604.1 AAA family ATPase [Nocardioides donggukensis]